MIKIQKRAWNLSQKQIAKYTIYISKIEPHTEKEKRDKKVLEYLFIHGYNATKIAELNDPIIICFSNRNKGKQLSPSSILEIAYKHFPELRHKNRQIKRRNNTNERIKLMKYRKKNLSIHIRQCAFCGAKDNLEEHHMIPLEMGGDNSEENLIFLCKNCHKLVSAYQMMIVRKRFKEGEYNAVKATAQTEN